MRPVVVMELGPVCIEAGGMYVRWRRWWLPDGLHIWIGRRGVHLWWSRSKYGGRVQFDRDRRS